MAEKVISPGVFTSEIDQTFLPSAVADIGAAVIGPTVRGPAMIPTVVSSYSEYQAIFGDSFRSGSNYYQYLTSHTAEQYLKHADKLTVVRILDGEGAAAPAPAYSFVPTGSYTNGHSYYTGSTPAKGHSQTGFVANSLLKIYTLGVGHEMNNTSASAGGLYLYNTGSADGSTTYTASNAVLLSGSKHNVRWEIPSVNGSKGTYG